MTLVKEEEGYDIGGDRSDRRASCGGARGRRGGGRVDREVC